MLVGIPSTGSAALINFILMIGGGHIVASGKSLHSVPRHMSILAEIPFLMRDLSLLRHCECHVGCPGTGLSVDVQECEQRPAAGADRMD